MKRHYPKLTPWGTNTRVIKAAPTKAPEIEYTFVSGFGHVLGRVTSPSIEAAKQVADLRWPQWETVLPSKEVELI